MKPWDSSRRFAIVSAAALSIAVAACGSSSKTSSSRSVSIAGPPPSTAPVVGTPPVANSGPGVGKPVVTVGDESSGEELALGALYSQALAAEGYTVIVKGNIGSSAIVWKALTSGKIDVYPEYTGTLLTAVAGDRSSPASAQQAYELAKAYVEKYGVTLLDQTPFSNSDTLVVTKAFAAQHGLVTIEDLGKLGHSLKLGGAPAFAASAAGLVELRQAYGLDPTFVPLAKGSAFGALDHGRVQAIVAPTTDGQLTQGKYVLLSDPERVFGFHYVAPVVSRKVLAAEGPAFSQTMNRVSALLTLPAIQRMNAAVMFDQQAPMQVAHQFLLANGIK